jgi:hypothetical protein
MDQPSPSLNPAPTTGNPNKNRNIWIGVGIAAFLCICACGIGILALNVFGKQLGQQIENSSDPAQIEAVKSQIASYDIPAGYSEQMALDLGMYRMLALVSSNPAKPMIMLMGYNQSLGANDQQMQEQLQRSFEQQLGTPGMTWRTIEERTMTIRGQEVIMVVREGQTENGAAMRQMMTAFEGEHGTVLVMAQGLASAWDQDMLDEFLASIE